MANSIGLGTGYGNPYLQAAKLNQSGPAQTYDPSQTLDATQMAQQVFQQQAAQRSQAFNQENPRMALPQNIGAAFGGLLSRALTPKPQQQGSDQPQQPDISSVIQAEYTKRFSQILANQPSGSQNYAAAQYQAATSLATDPQYGQSQVTQAIAAQYIKQAKENGYTPETEASANASNAQKNESVAKEKDAQTQMALAIQAAKDKNQYVPVKWTTDPNTNITYPKQVGAYIPRYINDNLTEDPQLQVKKNAAIATAGGAQQGADVIPLDDYNNNKAMQNQLAIETAKARIQATAKAQQDKNNNLDSGLITKGGHLLYSGADPSIIDAMVGTGASATPMRQAMLKAAIEEGEAKGIPYDPTDAHIGAMNQKAFESGTPYQQFSRLETLPAHAAELRQTVDALGNGSFKPGNALYQKAIQMNGGKVAAPFQLAKTLAMTEMAASLSTRGGGADKEIDRLTAAFENADNPASLNAAVDEAEGFWQRKAQDVGLQYNTALHGRKNFVPDQLTDPVAVELLTRRYPVDLPAGKKGQLLFSRLPDTAWVTQGSNPPAQVKDYKAMLSGR